METFTRVRLTKRLGISHHGAPNYVTRYKLLVLLTFAPTVLQEYYVVFMIVVILLLSYLLISMR